MVKIADYRFLKLEIKSFERCIEDIDTTEREMYGTNSKEARQLRELLSLNRSYYLAKIRENTEQIKAIEGLVGTLSEPLLTIVKKRFYDGLKFEKIAEVVYLDRTSVSKHISKCVKELEARYNEGFEQVN